MAELIVHNDKIENVTSFAKVCPFGAMEIEDGKIKINSACKMCKLCVKSSKNGEVEYIDTKKESVDKSLWNGIAVYVDHVDGKIHPVTLELIGKAKELANKINHKVYCLFMGSDISDKADELLHYGVDKVFVYDNKNLKNFSIEPYTAVFEDFINTVKPSSILVGATTVGRQLAPRVAARFKTGLTADCTILDIDKSTDLIQIRPAFGGNIMAQICTPDNRPQLATVRYKIMATAERQKSVGGEKVICNIDENKLTSRIEVLDVTQKPKESSIENASVIVAVGRGVKSKDDISMCEELAELLNGEIACTRPIVEAGWMDAKKQIGLSGRTVRPKLIITIGISGSVQFAAGMNNSDCIIAVNKDPKASIFNIANYGIVGDIYEIVPELIGKIKNNSEVN